MELNDLHEMINERFILSNRKFIEVNFGFPKRTYLHFAIRDFDGLDGTTFFLTRRSLEKILEFIEDVLFVDADTNEDKMVYMTKRSKLFCEFDKDDKYFDVRIWYWFNDDNIWRPTHRGFRIKLEEANQAVYQIRRSINFFMNRKDMVEEVIMSSVKLLEEMVECRGISKETINKIDRKKFEDSLILTKNNPINKSSILDCFLSNERVMETLITLGRRI